MGLIDDDYLLESDAARELYGAVEDAPIIDPHNHIDLEEVVENEPWDDLWEVQGATDHYVWQVMRKRGVPEEKVTGDASNREKFDALADVMPELAGNPVYDWFHLDLKRRFGIETPLGPETAEEIWAETKAQLAADDMRPQAVLRDMDVEVLCSSDDPTSELAYHERAADEVEGVDIRPTFRPDRAMKIDTPRFDAFREDLGELTEQDLSTFTGYQQALAERHAHFVEHGCLACDIGTGTDPVSKPVSEARAAAVYRKALRGKTLTPEEVEDFKAYMLEFVGALNAEAGWVTQLHIGAVRDYRRELYDDLGKNAGGDVSTDDVEIVDNLDYFLDRFDGEMEIIGYVLDPNHYPSLTTVARTYPNLSVGPAWWFNDSPHGMETQLEYVANTDLLANYAGMVSDSRKVMSYGSRFEMFRRTLANVLGRMVERGRVPHDVAEDLIEHVCYDRPKELYGF